MASFITSTNPFITETFDLGNTLATAEEVIEQTQVIDAVRAKPFTDDSTH